MIIAVASKGLSVADYFKHCTDFTFYTVEDGLITRTQNIPSTNYSPKESVDMMKSIGVEVLIVDEISSTVCNLFETANITVVKHAQGNSKNATEEYLDDYLPISFK